MKSLAQNNSKYFEMCSRRHLKCIIKITRIYNSKCFSTRLPKKKSNIVEKIYEIQHRFTSHEWKLKHTSHGIPYATLIL